MIIKSKLLLAYHPFSGYPEYKVNEGRYDMNIITNGTALSATKEISSKRSLRVNFQIPDEAIKALEWITSEYSITQKEVFEIICSDENILKKSKSITAGFSNSKLKYSTKVISKGALNSLDKFASENNIKRDVILSNALIVLRKSLFDSKHTNHSEALQLIGEFWSYCEKVEKDISLSLTSNDPIVSRFGIIVTITANLYSSIQAELNKGIKIDPEDFSQTGAVSKIKDDSIVFKKTITEAEYNSNYLNLKDDSNKSYGKYFPKHKTPLLIISENDEYMASKKDRTQIWGGLRKWYKDENIKVGDVIRIKYKIEEELINGRVPVYIDVVDRG